jgi:regulator of sigma D
MNMLEGCKTAQERWGGVHKLIDGWLNGRQELIVLFCNLSASKPLSAEQHLGSAIQRFCQSMMDYCSAGHFEIYEQLINEAKEYDDGGVELASTLVPKLDALTGRCVDFNDTYDEHCTFEQLAQLPHDLSAIGEILEERFELEDQLIARLHTAHRELATV